MGRLAHVNELLLKQLVAEKAKCLVVDVDRVLNSYFEVVNEYLDNGASVRMLGRGYMRYFETKPTRVRLPHTGELIKVPARRVLVYKESKPK